MSYFLSDVELDVDFFDDSDFVSDLVSALVSVLFSFLEEDFPLPELRA